MIQCAVCGKLSLTYHLCNIQMLLGCNVTFLAAAEDDLDSPVRGSRVGRAGDLSLSRWRTGLRSPGYAGSDSGTIPELPRVLLITADKWELGARFSAELRKRGFAVGVVAPRGQMARKALTGDAYYDFRRFWKLDWFGRIVKLWNPDFIICVDDWSRRSLLGYYTKALSSRESDSVGIIQVIRKSLGAPEAFQLLEKSRLMTLATRMGVRCPPTSVIPDIGVLGEQLDRSAFPLVLKADGGFGGRAVRIVHNREDATRAFHELRWPVSWPQHVKKTLAGMAGRLPRFIPPIGVFCVGKERYLQVSAQRRLKSPMRPAPQP